MAKKYKNYIVVPEIVQKIKISFCLKYFDFSNSDSLKQNEYKKFFKLLKNYNNNNNLSQLINDHSIIIEKSKYTINLAKSLVKDDNFFYNNCNGNVYDLIRGNTPLRIFGIL
ncbi:hypothetical protein SKUN_00344 [Spiroplasma kunkelii CR2-3x]|uniref:Uncharacterized protein n=1 Tax=Spiroplasma kunkelii CR2-3x TaxID=273035 RepID=A0A0K2JFB5_SPIKU|nr:hypothetical protein [Spiroplasma kunkelii]ALA97260.1 hypothetical protein SKUN_00344 [Spiroplasma kunkelii CR2-3x]